MDPITVRDVYQWLTEGTKGSKKSYWFKNEHGERPWATNYPTPAHLFEQHTRIQMKSFLSTLDLSKYTSNSKYKVKKVRLSRPTDSRRYEKK